MTEILLKQQSYKQENINNINYLMQRNLSTFSIHQQTFPQFRNCNLGKKIVIVATGPSALKYQPIKDAIHIGVNRAIDLKEKIESLDFDYYFVQDYFAVKNYLDKICEYKNKNNQCIKFFGLTNEFIFDYTKEQPNRTIPDIYVIKANALRYRTDWEKNITDLISQQDINWCYDLSSKALHCGGTVVFPALQFALWTHPKEIHLIGCDCTTNGYFYKAQQSAEFDPDFVIQSYKSFKKFAEKYYPDIKIYSINPVGLKGIFEDLYTENYEKK